MMKRKDLLMFYLLMEALSCPVLIQSWTATVVKKLDTLVSSCVVIPCSFTHAAGELSTSKLRPIWHRSDSKTDNIYHQDPTKILYSFQGRTRMLGQLAQGNCTLEIKDIKNHDDGKFCFRIEIVRTPSDPPTWEKFSFVEDCVQVTTSQLAPKPVLHQLKNPVQGKPFAVTCSIQHNCPTHQPTLSWNKGKADDISGILTNINFGYWRTESILTFIPEEKDDHTDLTCTALFNGGPQTSVTTTLYVKRTENYNHIIIPITVALVTAGCIGIVCIFVVRKYKGRIAELQRREGSIWNRMSRMSRRRPRRDTPEVGYCSDARNNKSSAEQKSSKPRFPSPKSHPKSYNQKKEIDDNDYINSADLNVYGNI